MSCAGDITSSQVNNPNDDDPWVLNLKHWNGESTIGSDQKIYGIILQIAMTLLFFSNIQSCTSHLLALIAKAHTTHTRLAYKRYSDNMAENSKYRLLF